MWCTHRLTPPMASWILATLKASGLDLDEYTRVTHAVAYPHRVDAQVVENVAAILAHCKRLEDTLGPREVLDTLLAQHSIVRHLLQGGCPDKLTKPLKLVESAIACTIGTCLINMGQHHRATDYFGQARRAGHDAGNPACAAYAAANASFSAFLRADTPTAQDMAAAARNLAARTHDLRLQALTEQMAAAAYALDGQYQPCMTACTRAQEHLANANGRNLDSLAYWVHHGTLVLQPQGVILGVDDPGGGGCVVDLRVCW